MYRDIEFILFFQNTGTGTGTPMYKRLIKNVKKVISHIVTSP